MAKITTIFKRVSLLTFALVQLAFYPTAAIAQTAPDTEADGTNPDSANVQTTDSAPAPVVPPAEQESVTVQAAQTPGPTAPTGADSQTFRETANGTWENDLYIWDPVTRQTRPKVPQDYSYNPDTGRWDTTEWRYNAPSGTYVPNVVSRASNPNAPTAQAVSPANQSTTGSGIAGTGPNSNNAINQTNNSNSFFNGFYNANVSNNIHSSAITGDATVQGNTLGGNAATGDAAAMANIINMLQSTWGFDAETASFIANIDGDVYGDLFIDTTGPSSSNNLNVTNNNNLDANIQNAGTITNDVNLTAQSGDANVSGNTTGGDATSGNANAVANIINLMNSMITAGQSFVGTININGNLNGDILLPANLLNYLIASTGPSSNNNLNSTNSSQLTANITDNQTINNNVNATAATGNANVANNTSAGGATTGTANTNVTILNLTGKEVVAENALLVFVNVLGRWVGAIINAPEGSTAAGLSNTGPNSNNNATVNNTANTDIDITNNSQITNNVNVTAATGDADVTGNTSGGNASTGDANAAVNIANVTGSNLKLSNWFGVLFINVFGSWQGSFGIDTPFGNTPLAGGMGGGQVAAASTTTNQPSASSNSGGGSSAPFAFRFAASTPQNDSAAVSSADTNTTATSSANTSTQDTAPEETPNLAAAAGEPKQGTNWWWTLLGLAAALSLLGLERFLAFRRK